MIVRCGLVAVIVAETGQMAAFGQEETLDSNYLLVFERTHTFIGIAIMTASPIVQKLGYSIAKKTNGRKNAEPRNALGQKVIDGFRCKVECRLRVSSSPSGLQGPTGCLWEYSGRSTEAHPKTWF